jgi:hypothetical protein
VANVWTVIMRRIAFVLLAAFLAGPLASPGFAQSADAQAIRAELNRLREELDAVSQQYAERLAALEAKLVALEGSAPSTVGSPPPQTVVPATPSVPVPAGAEGAGGPQGSLPVYGNVNALSKIFNPDLAVIGNFVGTGGENATESSPPLEMREIETSLQAIVDPYARADFFFALSPEGIDIEEGFITFPTLPGGVLLKAGKLRSAFGKVNAMHSHALSWTDRPLVTRNLIGGEEGIADAGMSAARLVPNPWIFLEATGEVYRGESTVFRSYERRDLTYVGRVRGYHDVTESSNLDFGASVAYGHNDAAASATTRLVGIDGTFRYRPLRSAIYRRLLARSELVWSRRSEIGGATAFGAYVATDYQLARRWFAGVRYDYAGRATVPDINDTGTSWLLTYWPSEFSQIRGQYRRTRFAEGHTANEVLFQFLFSIGAHGAHMF